MNLGVCSGSKRSQKAWGKQRHGFAKKPRRLKRAFRKFHSSCSRLCSPVIHPTRCRNHTSTATNSAHVFLGTQGFRQANQEPRSPSSDPTSAQPKSGRSFAPSPLTEKRSWQNQPIGMDRHSSGPLSTSQMSGFTNSGKGSMSGIRSRVSSLDQDSFDLTRLGSHMSASNLTSMATEPSQPKAQVTIYAQGKNLGFQHDRMKNPSLGEICAVSQLYPLAYNKTTPSERLPKKPFAHFAYSAAPIWMWCLE